MNERTHRGEWQLPFLCIARRRLSAQSSKLALTCGGFRRVAIVLSLKCKKRRVTARSPSPDGVHEMGPRVDDFLTRRRRACPRPDPASTARRWTPPRLWVYNPRLPNKSNGGSPRVVSTSASVFRLSRRLEEVGFSDIVKIRNKVMGLRAQGASVYQFEGGEPFLNTPEPIKEAMVRALAENRTRYAPSSGIPELRAAAAAKLRERNRVPAREEDVIVLNGGMQGLFAAFQSVVDPGEEVLVFSPFWTPIRDLIAHCQGRTVLVPSAEARREGFHETLTRYATERTRAVYFNTPQNPTGIVFTREEAEEVARFARERDLVVIADEAYEDLVYEGEHCSIASLEGMFERTITCFTLSKSYAMTGWRVGYAAASEPWMTGIKKCLLYTTNGVSTPSQYAAARGLRPAGRLLRGRPPRLPRAPRPARLRPQRAGSLVRPARRAPSTPSPTPRASTRTAAPPPTSCSNARRSRPCPASSSASTARDTSASPSRPRPRRSRPASTPSGEISEGVMSDK